MPRGDLDTLAVIIRPPKYDDHHQGLGLNFVVLTYSNVIYILIPSTKWRHERLYGSTYSKGILHMNTIQEMAFLKVATM